MFIASAIFLLAITTGGYAIAVSMTDNIERIYEVIEQRSGAATYSRKITVGALRSPIIKSTVVPSAKSWRPAMAKRNVSLIKTPQRQWPIAA